MNSGDVAQLGERHVRNVEVGGSNPPISTKIQMKNYLFVDVAYSGQKAVAAAVITPPKNTGRITACYTCTIDGVAQYEPGNFYKRELPCILKLLNLVQEPLETIFIDAYVWLSPTHPGLGAHLFKALDTKIPVIGIAKSGFLILEGTTNIVEYVLRGKSKRPLYVTAAGIDLKKAARIVKKLYKRYRIPYAMKESDSLARHKLRLEIKNNG